MTIAKSYAQRLVELAEAFEALIAEATAIKEADAALFSGLAGPWVVRDSGDELLRRRQCRELKVRYRTLVRAAGEIMLNISRQGLANPDGLSKLVAAHDLGEWGGLVTELANLFALLVGGPQIELVRGGQVGEFEKLNRGWPPLFRPAAWTPTQALRNLPGSEDIEPPDSDQCRLYADYCRALASEETLLSSVAVDGPDAAEESWPPHAIGHADDTATESAHRSRPPAIANGGGPTGVSPTVPAPAVQHPQGSAADRTAPPADPGEGTHAQSVSRESAPAQEPNPPDAKRQRQNLEDLRPAHRKAWESFQFAQEKLEKQLTDQEAYDFLKEEGPFEDMQSGQVDGYKLPDVNTWTRYLRKARQTLGEQKYNARAGRAGRSVVRRDQVE